MSLQRLLVYCPFAALVAVCLAVRVTSEQTTRSHDAIAPAHVPAAARVQVPRSVEASYVGPATTWLPSPPTAQPPADVPGLSGMEKASASVPAILKATGNEQALVKATGKTGVKNVPHTSEDAGSQKSSGQKLSMFKLTAQTPLRKPETWTPPVVYGPPLPPERIHVQIQAHQLRKDIQMGRITLVMDGRDGEQLERLERSGVYNWPAPPPNIVVRSERQRGVLAGTTEDSILLPSQSSRLQLASRSGELERTTTNPADDPEFDPCAVPPSPLLMRMLTTLAGRSTPAHPLQILSLLRPPYRYGGYVHVGPANPHSMGLAADIGAYGGHAIQQSDPDACVAATLALLRDLPPGRYRLGLPKAPEGGWDLPPALTALLNRPAAPTFPINFSSDGTRLAQKSKTGASTSAPEEAIGETAENTTACAISALYGLYASSEKPIWPFFPPPFTQIVANEAAKEDGGDEDMEPSANPASARTKSKSEQGGKAVSKLTRMVLRFQNEAYAPESDLTDTRLRKALEQARKRGVDIVAMFPDGADHIHVDVRQNP